MKEAVVGATIQVLLQTLISYGIDEFKLFQDSKKDLEKLGETLITIQEFVSDAETKQVTDKPVKRWRERLEDVAFEAYNVLDEVHYHSLRDNIPNSRSLKKQVKSIFSGSKRLKWGHKIRAINQEFQSINNDATGLGLQIRLASSQAPASPEKDSITSDPVFLGRDDDVCKIAEMLTNVPPEQPYTVLPIVGMGGMGKTTLAREVKKKMQTHFGTCIWVHVSPNFDPTTIFKKILQKLTLEKVEVNDRDVVLIKLQRALACKTYLLVLDDVWDEDRLKWEDFKNGLSGITSTKGNCIIVTTRSAQVASTVATHPAYELKGLREDICWSIIKAKAFEERDVIPAGFEASEEILQKDVRVCL